MTAIVVDIYCRTATDDLETPTKLEQQETACRAYCEAHSLSVGMVHTEVASGATYGREGLSLLRHRCRDQLIQGVVVVDLFRLSRSHLDCANLIQEMRATDVTLYCVYNNTTTDRLVRAVLDFVEVERK